MAYFKPTTHTRVQRYMRPESLVGYWPLGDYDPIGTWQNLGPEDVGLVYANVVTLGHDGAGDGNTSTQVYANSPVSSLGIDVSDLNAVTSKEKWTLHAMVHPSDPDMFWSAAYTNIDVIRVDYSDGKFVTISRRNVANQLRLRVYDGVKSFTTDAAVTPHDNGWDGWGLIYENGTFHGVFNGEVFASIDSPWFPFDGDFDNVQFEQDVIFLFPSGVLYMALDIAHLAFWNAVLTAGELERLSVAMLPTEIPTPPDVQYEDVFKVRIVDLETGVLVGEFFAQQVSVDRGTNNTGSWNFVVPFFMPNASILRNRARAYIMLNGVTVMDGIVTNVGFPIGEEGVAYTVSGSGEMSDLSLIRSKSDAVYEDTTLVAILNDLLTYAPGWELGDISTMEDPSVTTAIDVTGEERLLPQITQAIDSVPGTYYRYGGIDGLGNRLIDIGSFGDTSGIFLEQPNDAEYAHRFNYARWGRILSISVQEDSSEIINEIEAYGGDYEDADENDRTIEVHDATALHPELLDDPDFPIVTYDGILWLVRNNAVWPSGASVTRYYDEHTTPDNKPATANRIMRAAYAVYKHAVKDLLESAETTVSYDITATGLTTALRVQQDLDAPTFIAADIVENGELTTTTGWTASGLVITPATPGSYIYSTALLFGILRQETGQHLYPNDYVEASVILQNHGTLDAHITLVIADEDGIEEYTNAVTVPAYGPPVRWYVSGTFTQNLENLTFRMLFSDTGSSYECLVKDAVINYTHVIGSPIYEEQVFGVLPNVGQTAFVRARAEGSIHDGFTGTLLDPEVVDVNEALRIDAYTLNGDENGMTISLKATPNVKVISEDEVVHFFDELKPKKKRKKGVITNLPAGSLVTNNTSAGPGLAPDTTLTDGTDARLITVPLASVPGWAVSVSLASLPTLDPSSCRYEIITNPVIPATGLTVAVSGSGGLDWTTASSADVTATFLYE